MPDRTKTRLEIGAPLFETVLRTVADGITVVDASGRLVYANEAAARTIGFESVEELLATPVDEVMEGFDVFDEEGNEFPLEALPGRRALAGGHPDPVLLRFRPRGGGEERWSVVAATPVVDGDGSVVAAAYAFHDVTATKHVELEQRFLSEATDILNRSLDLHETLANLAELAVPALADWCIVHRETDGRVEPIAIGHPDPEKREWARRLNSRWPPDPAEDAGIPAVLRTGRPALYPDITDDMLVAAARDSEHLEAIRSLGMRSVMTVPINARGRVLGTMTFVWAESGRRYDEGHVAFAQTFAERAGIALDNARLYEQAEERGHAALVLSHVADGVFLVDAEGIVRFWNRAAETITGISAQAAVGSRAAETVPGWAAIAALVPVAEIPGESPVQAVPVENAGRERWLSVSGVSFDEGTVYAFRDLTEERRVDELKTDFLATASHELRTPLAAVYGAAMTLRRTDLILDEERRQVLLGVIASEADRLSRIIDDILWASRLDSGRLTVSIERCDATELAAAVVRAAEAHAPERLRIRLVAPGDLPPIAADGDKVRQVLANLLDNAIKYSPDGGSVEVHLEPHERRVLFAVKDEGIGIPLAEQPRVFEKFFRLDPQLTRGVGGTGLGLYICRELVHRMEGRIWVASGEERGSTFFFELPVAE
jgi:PAS domain S-box-containing protein